MPVLHIGVADVLYSEAYKAGGKNLKDGERAHNATYGKGATTGDVAEILEEKYGLFSAFFTAHEQDICDALETSVSKALESMLMGASVDYDAFGGANSRIEEMFKDFISSQEAEQWVAGAPTGAAKKGVNHRLLHPYAKANPRRPSFRDTGLMQASAKSWVD